MLSPAPDLPFARSTSSPQGVVGAGHRPRTHAFREHKRSSWREVSVVRGQVWLLLLTSYAMMNNTERSEV
jgi:hypothetical protein